MGNMRNAEGKMRNGMCGATVIGRAVTPRDRIYSAFRTPQFRILPIAYYTLVITIKCNLTRKLSNHGCGDCHDSITHSHLMQIKQHNHCEYIFYIPSL